MRVAKFYHAVLRKLHIGSLYTVYFRMQSYLWAVAVEGIKVRGKVHLRNYGEIRIGSGTRINSGPANFVGHESPMALETTPTGSIVIGQNCAISNTTMISRASICIGNGVFIGGGSKIFDNDFHHIEVDPRLRGDCGASKPVVIADNVFIGAFSIILKGVVIGDGAVIGAGSVVTRSVPANEIWAGAPAKKLREIHENRRR